MYERLDMEVPFSIDEVICVKEVSVVQAIEAGKLKACLQWIVDKLQAQEPNNSAAHQQEIQKLRNDNAGLSSAFSDLAKQQVRLDMQLRCFRGVPRCLHNVAQSVKTNCHVSLYEHWCSHSTILRSDRPSSACQDAIQETLAKEVESRQELSKVLPVSF